MGKPWLSLTALLSFIPSFAAARLFTFFRPSTVIVVFGVHVHHFWYGLGLFAMAGWLGIAGPDRWTRVAAVMYGMGAGLVADEIGLLLTPPNGTLGNYQSGLTYTAVVGIIAVALMLSLFSRYRREIIDNFRTVGVAEPLIFISLFVIVIPFVVDYVEFQASLLGIIVAIVYRWKLGGRWRLGRRSGVFHEAAGVILVFLTVFSVAYLIAVLVGIPSEGTASFLLDLSRVLIILLSATVVTGLFAGWTWVRFIVGPKQERTSSTVGN